MRADAPSRRFRACVEDQFAATAFDADDEGASARALRTRLLIDGMHSVHAVRAIQVALTPIEGISGIETSLGEIVIEHDGRATCKHLTQAIATAGYRVNRCTDEPRALPTLG